MGKFNEDEIKRKAIKKKNGCVVINFAIKDCPLWLYKWFLDDTNRYNDVYWVRLKELHDMLMTQDMVADAVNQQPVEVEKVVEELKEKKVKTEVVKTFSGSEEVKIDEKKGE